MTRSTRLTTLLLLTAAGLLALTGCDNSGSNEPEATTYTADLTALNNSGVNGQAEVTVQGGEITVTIDAEGTEAEQVHPQHIHGSTDGSRSTCPTIEADSDGNGRISVSEGGAAYGSILVPLDGSLDTAEGLGDLETFPMGGTEGNYMYTRSIATTDLAVNEDRGFEALNLSGHAIVMHGITVDGEYTASLPVACGALSQ